MYAVPDQAGKLARRARDAATAARLWGEAERLTGTALPTGAGSTH